MRAFVVNSLQEGLPQAVQLLVQDTLIALQRLAERHRESYDIPVIGITGSNGKTVVKEWLYQMLSPDAFTALAGFSTTLNGNGVSGLNTTPNSLVQNIAASSCSRFGKE